MKITRIAQQIKQANRYSVFVDGKYAFGLSDGALLESKLVVGQEVDAVQLKNFKQLSDDDKAYAQALRYAALRLHSEWEMASYLKRKKIDESLTEKIITKLKDLQFLDDTNFARAWVQNRRLLKPVSRRRLTQELRQKRVSSEIIEETLREDPADEAAVLAELIKQKRKTTKYQDNLKLMQYLARQGFSYSDIKSALAENNH